MRLAIILLVFALFCNSCMSSGNSSNDGCSVAECINGDNDDLSSAILCNGCLAKTLSNRDSAIEFHDSQQRLGLAKSWLKRNVYRRKTLIDLDTDCLQIIFDQLGFFDIMKIRQLFPARRISEATLEFFWKHYREYTVVFEDHFHLQYIKKEPNDGDKINFDHVSKRIQVGYNKDAPTFLRFFGAAIKNLEAQQPKPIMIQGINKYTSNSLTNLTIYSIKEKDAQLFTNTFARLEELTIYFGYNFPQNASLKCSQIFPKLKRLIGYPTNPFDYSFMDFECPSLEYFELEEMYNDKMKDFENMLKKNPQLRALKTRYLWSDVYDLLDKYSVNLTNLTISGASVKEGTRFDRLKKLEFVNKYSDGMRLLKNITFPCLETLVLNLTSEISDSAVEFVRRHQSIRHLEVLNYETWNYSCDELNLLLAEMPLLQTMIHLNSPKHRSISKRYTDDWEIVADERESYLFLKRKPKIDDSLTVGQ